MEPFDKSHDLLLVFNLHSSLLLCPYLVPFQVIAACLWQ